MADEAAIGKEGVPFELATLAAWPDVAAPEETGRTFAENARVKALYYAAHTGELTVAEDSGLRLVPMERRMCRLRPRRCRDAAAANAETRRRIAPWRRLCRPPY